jgi:hypothetical protein
MVTLLLGTDRFPSRGQDFPAIGNAGAAKFLHD